MMSPYWFFFEPPGGSGRNVLIAVATDVVDVVDAAVALGSVGDVRLLLSAVPVAPAVSGASVGGVGSVAADSVDWMLADGPACGLPATGNPHPTSTATRTPRPTTPTRHRPLPTRFPFPGFSLSARRTGLALLAYSAVVVPSGERPVSSAVTRQSREAVASS